MPEDTDRYLPEGTFNSLLYSKTESSFGGVFILSQPFGQEIAQERRNIFGIEVDFSHCIWADCLWTSDGVRYEDRISP